MSFKKQTTTFFWNLQLSALAALCLFTLFFFLSCSSSGDRFLLEGQFSNINQGEFYIYNYEDGSKDTIAVNDGRFVYEISTADTVILTLLFPNFSEIPVFAAPGVSLKMTGDVSHLRETEVEGSPDNEEMTAFRLRTNDMMPPEVEQAAEQFITDHPAMQVSNYLLRRYILQSLNPDYSKAFTLCSLMHVAQPRNVTVARLQTQLQALRHNTSSGKLPHFSALTTKGDTIANRQLDKPANIILVWAPWMYDSYSVFRRLKTFDKEHPNRISVMAITMDAAPSEAKKILDRDSILWPIVCDSMLWKSPLTDTLGICTLPANIITDKYGNIVARNLKDNDLMQKVEELVGQ